MFVIHDFIEITKTKGFPTEHRKLIIPGVYCLLDMCSDNEFSSLHVSLDAAGKIILKKLHEDYDTRHKYRGKY
eukprot:Pgem_evm1s13965